MSFAQKIREQFALLWKFLGFFQPPFMRLLHALVVAWVGVQLLTSTLMGTPLGGVHMYSGLLFLPLACFFTGYAFKTRGLKRYYGYLWGEVDTLIKDVKEALRFKLVSPRPGGLATLVQGLGFGALLLTLGTGAGIFVSHRLHWQSVHVWGDAHEFSVGLLIAYVCGHGIMALLHFAKWQTTVLHKPAPQSPHSNGGAAE